MRAGDMPAAWRISDAVLAARDPATRDDPRLPYHLRWVWDGRPLDSRHVLVRCYHGLGDTLQFARYLAPLRARAASVTLEVQPALMGLLRGMAAVDRLVPFDPARPAPARDADVEIMELSHALRLLPEQVPALALARPEPIATGAIGLCWAAGDWDPSRSVPFEALLACMPRSSKLVSLQRGPEAASTQQQRFLNPQDNDCDVSRTAALILGARLVVTVDTMVAHLAGSLGAPTWLLLKHAADWRWGQDDTATRWYGSVRLRRQHAPGDWSFPLEGISASL